MIEIFKTSENGLELTKIDKIEKGCWINLIAPSEDELCYIQNKFKILPNFLRDPLDEEEKPRIDIEDNQALVIVDIPYVYEHGKNHKYETLPLGLLITDDYFITVCLKANIIIDYFKEKKIREFFTFKKTRFVFQVLFVISKEYLKYLRQIDRNTDEVEKSLHKSMRNKELFKLLEMEKSLVFFTTSLKSNEMMMEKLLRGKYIKMYEEDQDLLEDVIIENKQAIEMANIYSTILGNMMGTFASVISNNLNMVMKFLASMTIVMAIPTMISSFFGMNVPVPFTNNAFGFAYITFICIAAASGAIFILSKKGMF